jgi:hypothetical protein
MGQNTMNTLLRLLMLETTRANKEEFYGIPQSMTFHKLEGINVPLNRFCAG